MYKALYRKWRPQTFDDVISQSHVTDTLKNQLKSGKTAHAYLFTGSRGTGKTTCARIFAKALCCTNPIDGNPCLECEVCKDAEQSKLSDIIEIDAASNNSVEDVRDLREGAVYLPERCKYKVYIIDEVHMLSASAFNALLKIMEEPPEFVKFILATTEIHKVPATILSRCQRFDFKRINPTDISSRLTYIAKNEGFTLSEDASLLIAKLSDGGMRDAISLLDQCSAYSENVTEEVVSTALGVAGRGYLFDTLDYLIGGEVDKVFKLVEDLYAQSKDLLVYCGELISHLRNVMILKVSPSQKDSVSCMPNEIDRLLSLSDRLSLETILSYLEALESCQNRMSRSGDRRVDLEVTLANLCNGIVGTSTSGTVANSSVSNVQSGVLPNEVIQTYNSIIDTLIARIDGLERQIANYGSTSNRNFTQPNAMVNRPVGGESPVSKCKYNPNDVEPIKQQWDSILNEFAKVNPSVWGTLDGSYAELDRNQGCVFITTENSMFTSLFKQPHNAQTLRGIMDRVLGSHYKVRVRVSTSSNDNAVQNSGQNYDIKNLVERAKSFGVPNATIE
jgi:DNA polymerase-3 subunit gamma/tau